MSSVMATTRLSDRVRIREIDHPRDQHTDEYETPEKERVGPVVPPVSEKGAAAGASGSPV